MYTTQDYIDSLYNDRANIVKNLNEKGVEASADETFTQLAPKILDISTGGGEGIYLKNTVEEMEAIDSPSEGDICLVYTKEQIHPLETSKFTKAIIRHTVTFETNEPGMSEFSSEDFNERLSVRVGTNYASVSYMTRDDYQDYSYDTTDGLTFTLNDYTEDVVLEFNSPLSNMMEYNASSAELLWIDDIDFSGLYEYKEGEWVYLDIDIKTAADQIFSPNKAYTSEGIIEGTTDPKTTYKIPIYIQADEPTDKNGIWIKPSYDYVSYARGKEVIMFTPEDMGPESNRVEQISTLPQRLRDSYTSESNSLSSDRGVFYHTYYCFGTTAGESYSIDLLTGEKNPIPLCDYLQLGGKRSVRELCLDKDNNDMYLILHNDFDDYKVYRYDLDTQTYEDKTSFLEMPNPDNSISLSWIHNNEIRFSVRTGGNPSSGFTYAYKIFSLADWSLIQTGDMGSSLRNFSPFRWIDETQIEEQSGEIRNAYTGATISTPENPDYGDKVWSSTLSKWIAGASNGVKINSSISIYDDNLEDVANYVLNFYNSDGTIVKGGAPDWAVPLEDKVLFIPRNSSQTFGVYAINWTDIKEVPTGRFSDSEVITLQIAPTTYVPQNNWTGWGLDALALNVKNAFINNEQYYEGVVVGANAAKYVYLGDGTNWNLIASNIYTEEA